jgi:hypothetical protein
MLDTDFLDLEDVVKLPTLSHDDPFPESSSATSECDTISSCSSQARRSSGRERVVPDRYVCEKQGPLYATGKRKAKQKGTKQKKLHANSHILVQRGQRFFFNESQKGYLREAFQSMLENPCDWRKQSANMQALSEKTHLSYKQIEKWFYNKKLALFCPGSRSRRRGEPAKRLRNLFPRKVKQALNEALAEYVQNPVEWAINSPKRLQLQSSLNITGMQASPSSVFLIPLDTSSCSLTHFNLCGIHRCRPTS